MDVNTIVDPFSSTASHTLKNPINVQPSGILAYNPHNPSHEGNVHPQHVSIHALLTDSAIVHSTPNCAGPIHLTPIPATPVSTHPAHPHACVTPVHILNGFTTDGPHNSASAPPNPTVYSCYPHITDVATVPVNRFQLPSSRQLPSNRMPIPSLVQLSTPAPTTPTDLDSSVHHPTPSEPPPYSHYPPHQLQLPALLHTPFLWPQPVSAVPPTAAHILLPSATAHTSPYPTHNGIVSTLTRGMTVTTPTPDATVSTPTHNVATLIPCPAEPCSRPDTIEIDSEGEEGRASDDDMLTAGPGTAVSLLYSSGQALVNLLFRFHRRLTS